MPVRKKGVSKKAPASKRRKTEEEDEEEEEKEEEKEEEEKKKKKQKKTPAKRGRKKKEESSEEEEEEKEEGPRKRNSASGAKAPKVFVDKKRPEECDAYWEDGDEADVNDANENNFAWPEKKEGYVKVVTWNVASYPNVCKKGDFDKYLAKEDPDVLCLNETKLSTKNEKSAFQPKGYHCIFYNCTVKAGYAGTAIFSKTEPINVIKGMGIKKHDGEGRLIAAEFKDFYVVATYIPNASSNCVNLDYRMEWDTDFLAFMKNLDAKKPVVWCGDLNVAHLWIDVANAKTNCDKSAGFTYKERDNFTAFLKEGFVDSYRQFFPKRRKAFTFWPYKFNARARDLGWRLDYFVVSRRLMPFVTMTFRRPKVMGSDHCPLGVMIRPVDLSSATEAPTTSPAPAATAPAPTAATATATAPAAATATATATETVPAATAPAATATATEPAAATTVTAPVAAATATAPATAAATTPDAAAVAPVATAAPAAVAAAPAAAAVATAPAPVAAAPAASSVMPLEPAATAATAPAPTEKVAPAELAPK
eukprot:TRINITY_DN346_c0_g8_i1.p1 TRINITY_DN346_c0_g8~~TRINITY_DN346_c0_g8_i1.p1  ORF type:complete len:536 (+),score=200.00 TRINITY_DN346_c0_g8_i1:60-1667(+)